MTNEELKTSISAHTPDTVFEETQFLNATIPAEKFYSLAKELLKADYDSLICVTGVDWKDSMMVVYHLQSRKEKHVVVLKVKLTDRVNPNIDTVCDIWRTAEFHEREQAEMFGVKFLNHPDLRLLILPDGWEGKNPMRKDFEDMVNMIKL